MTGRVALLLVLQWALGCSVRESGGGGAGGAQQTDLRQEICERLDACESRRETVSVDDCVVALAEEGDAIIESCAACFRNVKEACPPDDICEDACPRHGF